MSEAIAQLQGTAIPLSEAPCRGCADPCDAGARILASRGHSVSIRDSSRHHHVGHEELPKLDIDMSPLLGNVKPYGRQVRHHFLVPSDFVRSLTSSIAVLHRS